VEIGIAPNSRTRASSVPVKVCFPRLPENRVGLVPRPSSRQRGGTRLLLAPDVNDEVLWRSSVARRTGQMSWSLWNGKDSDEDGLTPTRTRP